MSTLLEKRNDPGTAPAPWHAGERALHDRLGLGDKMERIGRMNIRSFMPDQHREFFAQLPFLILGSVDAKGMPAASLLAGPPGFARSPDPHRLDIAARPVAGDPLEAALRPGAPVGILGIELPTRRRNRMNGRVIASDARGFAVAVDQSFGNCPQYIQRRDYLLPEEGRAPRVESLGDLDAEAGTLITRADTFFVASAALAEGPLASRGVDVSHRGGQPGFVGIVSDGALVVPDFRGNRFFNTLGNLLAHPQAGLLFPDFATGDLLQLEGATEILFDGPLLRAFRGAELLWRLRPARARWLRGVLPFRLVLGEASPHSLRTGTWREAQTLLQGDRG
ncbi:MAG TPA: pyridoxamine 5'-phosphate oxidase family protein [Dongiaceae bacterium]|nr:pyridoxamine 5'-phosphate oxidase family protein [Dongiaceae bacterium]